MSDEKLTVINAESYWANVVSPNQLSGKYQIDLSNLSDAAVDALQSQGISVKNKQDERGKFITVKSKNAIRYYDKNGEEITGILIGNGSKVKAVVFPYDWKSPTGKSGRSASLSKLVVTELVQFENAKVDVDLDEAL